MNRHPSLVVLAALALAREPAAQGACAPGPLELKGRVLPPPAAGQLRAELRSSGRTLDGERLTSERPVDVQCEVDGSFRLVVLRRSDRGPDVVHTLVLWVEGAGQDRPVRAARADWLGDLEPGVEHDLGTLTFVLPPLLAAGRAVEDGRGVPALVGVDRPRRDDRGEVCWTSVPSFQTRAGAEGSFEVRGFLPEDVEELRLHASHVHASSTAVVVPVGAGGILLGSLPRAELSGAARLEPELVPHVSIAAHGPVRYELPLHAPTALDEPFEEGAWLFGGRSFLPGDYRLLLSVDGESEPEIELGRVTLTAGAHARLPALDLGRLARRLRLTLHDEQGVPVRHARVQRRRPGAEAFEPHGSAREFEPGLWELATTDPELELLVAAPGRKRAHLTRVSGDRAVVLRRMLEVEVTLANLPLVAGSAFDVHLTLEDPLPGVPGHYAIGSVDRGRARMELAAPGRYQLSVTLKDPARCGRSAWKGTWIRLDVQDVEGLQHLHAQLSERDVAVLIERWLAADARR